MKKYSNFTAVVGLSENELHSLLDKGAFVASYLAAVEIMAKDIVPEAGFWVVSSSGSEETVADKIRKITDLLTVEPKAYGIAVFKNGNDKLLSVDLKNVLDPQQVRNIAGDTLNQIPALPECFVREEHVHNEIFLQLSYVFSGEDAVFFEESAEIIKKAFPDATIESSDCRVVYYKDEIE